MWEMLQQATDAEQFSSVKSNPFSPWCMHTQTCPTEKAEKTDKGEGNSGLGVGLTDLLQCEVNQVVL